MAPTTALIIPAAGDGRRMKSPTRKPFMTLEETPILNLTLERFLGIDGLAQTILAVHPDDFAQRDELLFSLAPLGVTDVVAGGATRTETVSAALAVLAPDTEIVLIHDAVRPFIPRRVIEGVRDAAAKSGAAVAAVPVSDTVKQVEAAAVRATLSRKGLYLVQTPQGFRREVIEQAYGQAGESAFTDDAGLVERIGGRVDIVVSTRLNFKITTPEDLELARAVLLAHRRGRLHF
ncbi:MAG: 2-C-methyl-D-erythritol 4-phosphate cytidylyltransferase [Planctomycetota bacterium]|jgi:2-C-methyl-D-erythritol 4-phosphate cytidylyltransferase